MLSAHDREPASIGPCTLGGSSRAWSQCAGAECFPAKAEIPGIGLITATAVVASVGNATQFRSARQFAAWLGLVPQQHSSGGKERLGHISKRGDGYIRRLLVHGARAHLSWSRRKKQIRSAWLTGLLARRPTNVVLLAMANKTARTAWAMLSRGERYQEMIAAAA